MTDRGEKQRRCSDMRACRDFLVQKACDGEPESQNALLGELLEGQDLRRIAESIAWRGGRIDLADDLLAIWCSKVFLLLRENRLNLRRRTYAGLLSFSRRGMKRLLVDLQRTRKYGRLHISFTDVMKDKAEGTLLDDMPVRGRSMRKASTKVLDLLRAYAAGHATLGEIFAHLGRPEVRLGRGQAKAVSSWKREVAARQAEKL